MRLFLDANVIFSAAHNERGRAMALFSFQRLGLCELVASPHALEEARRNIMLKYPSRTTHLDDVAKLLRLVPEAGSDAVARARVLGLPANDAPILAAAISSGSDVLVTGDRTHFGAHYGKRIEGVEILAPAEVLARLLRGN